MLTIVLLQCSVWVRLVIQRKLQCSSIFWWILPECTSCSCGIHLHTLHYALCRQHIHYVQCSMYMQGILIYSQFLSAPLLFCLGMHSVVFMLYACWHSVYLPCGPHTELCCIHCIVVHIPFSAYALIFVCVYFTVYFDLLCCISVLLPLLVYNNVASWIIWIPCSPYHRERRDDLWIYILFIHIF